jgi:D-alanyl-D-alanine carboxypeptidase (penicillin-binding protein 5/6)
MRRALLAVVALLAVLAAPVLASSDDGTNDSRQPASAIEVTAALPVSLAAPPAVPLRVPAEHWYLVGEDGMILAAHDSDARVPIASIPKLMTAVVALERAAFPEVVTVDSRAARIGGSTAFLRAGEHLTVAELLRAMLVPSANDAAMALALHVGRGSAKRFVARMNATARELGMDDTTFTNPHGLDEPGHLSSARDATLLIKYALGIPFLRDALARRSFSLDGRLLSATDDLVRWRPFIGGKTGHTDAAGWSEAAAAKARGVTVYGTVLGSDTRVERNDALKTLLAYGIDRYRRVTAIDADRVYGDAETGYDRPRVELVAPRTIVRTVLEGTPLVEPGVAPEAVGLPMVAGAHLGRVEVYAGDRLLASSNLVAASSVSEPGAFRKAVWYAQTTAENLWGLVT